MHIYSNILQKRTAWRGVHYFWPHAAVALLKKLAHTIAAAAKPNQSFVILKRKCKLHFTRLDIGNGNKLTVGQLDRQPDRAAASLPTSHSSSMPQATRALLGNQH